MTSIFFYGLFMDHSLLVQQGLRPDLVGPARLPGYRIHIGDRATLVPAESSRSYGMVMALSDEDARALYDEPSVREYRPEKVRVELLETGEVMEADCYNLPLSTGLRGNQSGIRRQARCATPGSAPGLGLRRGSDRVRRGELVASHGGRGRPIGHVPRAAGG